MGSPNKTNYNYEKGNIEQYVENLEKAINTQAIVHEDNYSSKNDFKLNIGKYDLKIQDSIKKYVHRTSKTYTDFKIIQYDNGLIKISSKKPGNVPNSYAIYNQILYKDGIIRTKYKDTYDNNGNFVHRHIKWPISEKEV